MRHTASPSWRTLYRGRRKNVQKRSPIKSSFENSIIWTTRNAQGRQTQKERALSHKPRTGQKELFSVQGVFDGHGGGCKRTWSAHMGPLQPSMLGNCRDGVSQHVKDMSRTLENTTHKLQNNSPLSTNC